MALSKEADKERKRKQREKAKQEQGAKEYQAGGLGDRPTVEDAEAAFGNPDREEVTAAKITKCYGKSQTWAGVMYQDSAPPDWEDKLRMIGVAFAVSPLHDQDKTQDGHLKKPHWHIILHWSRGSTTYKTAEGITRGVLCGTIPIPLVSPRGYYRYFCHLDNPKKAQYDSKDIVTGNGFDIGDFLELSSQEKAEIRFRLLELVIKSGMNEYWDLITYAMYNLPAAELDYICQNTMFWQTALRSKRHIEMAAMYNMTGNGPQARPDQRQVKQHIAQKEGETK